MEVVAETFKPIYIITCILVEIGIILYGIGTIMILKSYRDKEKKEMKIKVIDLLVKMANNEKIPKKIKFNGNIYEYKWSNINDDKYRLWEDLYLDRDLNEEIEIIEEPKKIEKISWNEKERINKNMNKTRTIIIDGIEIQTRLTGVEIANLTQKNKELEHQVKKQKEVIDKAIRYIQENTCWELRTSKVLEILKEELE